MGKFESLEGRQMFAASPAPASVVFGDGTMTVQGTAAAERVHFETKNRVSKLADGTTRSRKMLIASVIQLADEKTLASATFELRKLKKVNASLAGGADRFTVPSLSFSTPVVDGKSQFLPQSIKYVVDGGSGDDVLRGGALNDTLSGGAGDDSIGGSYGDDRLYGGDGNDTIRAGNGNDSLYGQAGDDLMYDDGFSAVNAQRHPAQYAKDSGKDVFDGGAGRDTLWATGRLDPYSGLEVHRNPGEPETDSPIVA